MSMYVHSGVFWILTTVQNLLFKAEGNAYILSYKPQYNTILMSFKLYVTNKMEKKKHALIVPHILTHTYIHVCVRATLKLLNGWQGLQWMHSKMWTSIFRSLPTRIFFCSEQIFFSQYVMIFTIKAEKS